MMHAQRERLAHLRVRLWYVEVRHGRLLIVLWISVNNNRCWRWL